MECDLLPVAAGHADPQEPLDDERQPVLGVAHAPQVLARPQAPRARDGHQRIAHVVGKLGHERRAPEP